MTTALEVRDITDHIAALKWCGYFEDEPDMNEMVERFVYTFAEPEEIE